MKLQRTLLATAILSISSYSFASSFQLNETSASGLGRSFSGDAVIADDASVLARNPAAMALFSQQSFSIAGTFIDPGVDIKGVDVPDFVKNINGGQYDVNQLDKDGVVPTAILPAIYYIRPINEMFAVGVGVNANFGLASEYDKDYAAGSVGGKTDLTTINFNFSGSYRVNKQFSVGVALNVVYGEAELTRHLGEIAKAVNLPPETELINMEGDDIGYGYNIGFVYEFDKNNRIGLGYHSKTEIAFDGDFRGLGAQDEVHGDLTIDMPAYTEFSGFHQLNRQWAMHYSAMYTQWSSFEKLEAYTGDGLVFSKEENFESTYRFALGATYKYSNELTLRAGMARDESAAIEDYRSISIPDSDRLWYSVGATYQLSKDDSIDFGFSFIDGDEVEVIEEDALLGELPIPPQLVGNNRDWHFKSEGNAILLSLQYNTKF